MVWTFPGKPRTVHRKKQTFSGSPPFRTIPICSLIFFSDIFCTTIFRKGRDGLYKAKANALDIPKQTCLYMVFCGRSMPYSGLAVASSGPSIASSKPPRVSNRLSATSSRMSSRSYELSCIFHRLKIGIYKLRECIDKTDAERLESRISELNNYMLGLGRQTNNLNSEACIIVEDAQFLIFLLVILSVLVETY